MKNYGAGNKALLALLYLVWMALAPAPLQGEPPTPRRLWFYEQLAEPPLPVQNGEARHQLGMVATENGPFVAARADLVLDLSVVEIRILAAQRWELYGDPEGVLYSPQLRAEHANLGAEIARYRVTRSGVYGRLSAATLLVHPANRSLWRVGVETGRLATAQVPWEFRLATSYFMGSPGSGSHLIVSSQANRHYHTSWGTLAVGGAFSWGHVLTGPEFGEQMLLTLGPLLAWHSPFGVLHIAVPMRMSIDTALIDNTKSNLSDFATPAVTLGWRLLWR